MAQKFSKLTRPNLRKLPQGKTVSEHGIYFERLNNGDGRFTVNIMVDGVRIHRVIGKESEGVTREKAEEFITQARTDARSGRLNLPKGRKTALTLRKAVGLYLEKLEQEGGKDILAKKRRLNQHVIPSLGDKPLSQISTFDIECFKKGRQDTKAQNGTINRELAALSHLLNKAIEWKWITNKPCIIRRLKETTSKIVYLTTEQISQLKEAAKHDQHPHVYPFIVIGLDTAMRRMEILSIRIKDIDLERNIIHIPQAKAGSREQPITQHLAEFLNVYIEGCPSWTRMVISIQGITYCTYRKYREAI